MAEEAIELYVEESQSQSGLINYATTVTGAKFFFKRYVIARHRSHYNVEDFYVPKPSPIAHKDCSGIYV